MVPLSQFAGSGPISKATYSTLLESGLGFTSLCSQTGEGAIKNGNQLPVLQMGFP